MPLPCYLAMTCAEFNAASALPEHVAWMACHFSCYGTGLSNLPRTLPEGAMVIVNDRTPVQGHDPCLILDQLLQLFEDTKPGCFLLDLQRPDVTQTAKIVRLLAEGLPCPVGISEHYAAELDRPVFLSPPALHVPLEAYLSNWAGRELWLEAALETAVYTVTTEGCSITATDNIPLPEPVFTDEALCCRYHIEQKDASAIFTLQRSKPELDALLAQAETFGITAAVGLYQQLVNG